MPFDLDLPDPQSPSPWYDLNWSLIPSLRRSQRKLTKLQRYYLQQIEDRVREFPQSFARPDSGEDDYVSVACMIAMACARAGAHDRDASADLPFQDRFCHCRRIARRTWDGEIRHDGVCGQRRFCCYCNYLLRQQALLTYVPAFDRGCWYAMTVSSTTDLDLELDELTYSWDAAKAVVRALVEAGHFQGAYWTEELHLQSLYPEIRVLPHGHALFHAVADADEAAAHALAMNAFRRYFADIKRQYAREDQADGVTILEPEIQLTRLRTKRDLYEQCDLDSTFHLKKEKGEEEDTDEEALYKWTDYLTKTMRIVDAYRDAMSIVPDEERGRVNYNFEQFLHGILLMLEEDSPPRGTKKQQKSAAGDERETFRPRSRIQRHSLGTLRPGRSRRFVGIRPAQRYKYRRELKELRRKIIAERVAS